MSDRKKTITACVVIHNEEKIIERCLSSIMGLVNEIIVIHDGECSDNSLEIVKKFTDKIFIRPYMGFVESHLVFAYKQAGCDWLLRLDADEYFDLNDHENIRRLLDEEIKGYAFKWELWDGQKAIDFKGLYKSCLFKKESYSFCDIPGNIGKVDGKMKNVEITLHHRPAYSNISWEAALRKTKKWAPIQAKYFFPNLVNYECFKADSGQWVEYAERVRKYIAWYLIKEPIKIFIGQLKNGKWRSYYGWQFVLQHSTYYFFLYFTIWKMKNKLSNPNV